MVGLEIAALAVEDLILVVGAVNALVCALRGDEGQQGRRRPRTNRKMAGHHLFAARAAVWAHLTRI